LEADTARTPVDQSEGHSVRPGPALHLSVLYWIPYASGAKVESNDSTTCSTACSRDVEMPRFGVEDPMYDLDQPTIVQGAFRYVGWRDSADDRKAEFRLYGLPM
jgi:hypothetical protein